MRAVCILLTLFLASTLWAQQLPDSPETPKKDHSPGEKDAMRSGVARQQRIERIRVADSEFWLLNTALCSSSIANVELTSRCMAQHHCYNRISPVETRSGLYGFALPVDLGVAAVSYKLKGHRKRHWWAPAVIVIGTNMAMAARSATRAR